MENTYSRDPMQPPRTAMADLLLTLALALYDRGDYSGVETRALRFFVALGVQFAITATSFQVAIWVLVIEPTVTDFPVLWGTYGPTRPTRCDCVEACALVADEVWDGERFGFEKCFGSFRPCGLREALAKASMSKIQNRRKTQKRKKLAAKMVETGAAIKEGSDTKGKAAHNGAVQTRWSGAASRPWLSGCMCSND